MRRNRLSLVAAGLAVAMTAVLGALQSVVWNGADAPALATGIAAWLDPGLLHGPASDSLAQPTESYFGYGRWVSVIYVLLFMAAAGLRRVVHARVRWALVGLGACAVVGDGVAYWASERGGPDLRRLGFWYTELPALVAIVLALSGVGIWALIRRADGRVFVAALPISIATTAALGYLPHGLLLGCALTLLAALWLEPAARIDPAGTAPGLTRTARAALAVGLATWVLFVAATYRPNLVVGPSPLVQPLPPIEVMRGARLHVFNTGYNRMSWWLVGRERPWRPVPAFVLEQPDGELIVFDTGFSDAVAELGEAGLHIPERWVIESRGTPDWTLPNQMRKAGLSSQAVRLIVVSHLHGDHVGQLEAFGNAPVAGGPGSASFAQEHGFGDRWTEVTFGSSEKLGPFDSVVRADDSAFDALGLTWVQDGGHASEGLMLLVALDAGPVLLAGDAVVHADWLHSNDVQRIVVDAGRAAEVRNQVRAFNQATPDAAVFYGHDLRNVDCTRRDIVCHGAEHHRPEGGDARVPRS